LEVGNSLRIEWISGEHVEEQREENSKNLGRGRLKSREGAKTEQRGTN